VVVDGTRGTLGAPLVERVEPRITKTLSEVEETVLGAITNASLLLVVEVGASRA
jgi:hypothetical protein